MPSTHRTDGRSRTARAIRPWMVFAASLVLAAVACLTYRTAPAGAAWTSSEMIWESASCGVTETMVVPAGVTGVRILAIGGRGGDGAGQGGGQGGAGARPSQNQQSYPVVAGQTISMVVGCDGANGGEFTNDTPTPGWANGGGAGRGHTTAFGGGASGGAGGGATGVCIGTSTCGTGASLRVVAGGGGGGGTTNCDPVDENNSAGGNAGFAGSSSFAGGQLFAGYDGATSNGAGGAGARPPAAPRAAPRATVRAALT